MPKVIRKLFGFLGHPNDEIAVGMYYVTLITEGKNDTWYIASCLEKHDNDRYKMEYLQRVQDKSNLKWKMEMKNQTF